MGSRTVFWTKNHKTHLKLGVIKNCNDKDDTKLSLLLDCKEGAKT